MIDFAPGVGGTILLTGGELDITEDLNISGPAAGQLAVSGGGASRVLADSAGAAVTLSGLTITGGLAAEGPASGTPGT